MPLGGVTNHILDGQLGTVALKPGRTPIVCGVSSAGTANTCKLYAGNQQAQIITDYGYGPMVQMACRLSAKGLAVAVCKSAQTTAGVAGAVTASVPGGGTSVVSVTGAPLDSYRAKMRVVGGGTIASATPVISIQVSLDNGETWQAVQRLGTANTYVIPNTGLTLNFAAGTLVAGDSYTFRTTTEPKWSATDMGTAIDAIGVSGIPFDFGHIVGSCTATEAATIKTKLDGWASLKRFKRFFIETVRIASQADWTVAADATWQAVLVADWATFTSKRLAIGAGDLRTVSAVDESVYMRPLAWHACERAASVDSARYELGRVKDDGAGTGPLDASLYDPNGNIVGHNELEYPGLDEPAIAALGFMTATTVPSKGRAVYIEEAKLFSQQGSDFSTWRLGRVIDMAEDTLNEFFADEIEETPPVNRDGTIQTAYGDFLEAEAEERLDEDLVKPGRLVDRIVKVDRSVNLLQTKTDVVKASLLPFGESKYIDLTIGFTASLPTP